MHRRFLSQGIGLFLLLRFAALILAVDDTLGSQRKCISNVCFNGGSCVVEDRPNGESPVFECLCPEGFTGTLCEEVLNCSLLCENGGKCRFKEQKPFCACKQGFGGHLCRESVNCQQTGCSDNEICLFDLNSSGFKCQTNKCLDNPCKNNSTCRAIPNDYICECSGLRGRNCEEDIDECKEEEPCLNDGECQNLFGDFKCKCHPGFSGKICEQRSGFCVQKPCGAHGKCEELDGTYECTCDEGFYGRNCERMKLKLVCEKPRVLVETEDGVSKCLCPNGMQGAECDNSIEECTVDEQPCKNEGVCIRKPDDSTFCKCPELFVGQWCENRLQMSEEGLNQTFVNSCSPNMCLNGGECNVSSGYPRCLCPETFAGKYCQLECKCSPGTICRENPLKENEVECLRVENLASLITNNEELSLIPTTSFSFVDLPPISDFKVANISSCDECLNAQKCVYADQRLMCLCEKGFEGPLCAKRSNACSTIKCSGNQVCNLRRTSFGDLPYCACPNGTFGFNCQRKLPPATFKPTSVAVIQAPTHVNSKEHEFSLEFTFRTTVPNVHLATGENILNELDFSLELVDGYLTLQLRDKRITDLLELRLNDADWYTVVLSVSADMELVFELHDADTGYVLAHKPLDYYMLNVFTVRFGRRKSNSFFTGCLREIRVSRTSIDVFAKESVSGMQLILNMKFSRSVDVLQGCQFQPQCKPDLCTHGSCVELWNSYRCECRRPYLPPNCMHELQEATFGKDNITSSLVYSIQPEASSSFASSTDFSFFLRTNKPFGQLFYIGQSQTEDDTTFISCELQNGTIVLNSRLGGKAIAHTRSRRRVDDNVPHLLEIRRRDNNFTMFLDDSKEGSMVINRPFAHPLIVDRVILGGDNPQASENQSDVSLFKGTLQDIRLNDGVNLLLSETVPDFIKPNQSLGTELIRHNVLMGTVSEDLCSILKPCVQGTCENNFNDYTCACHKGYMGKNCELIDFCSNSPCSSITAQCVNTHGGYICKAPATFAKTSRAKFQLMQSADSLSSSPRFSFAIRTRTSNAQVFKMSTSDESLSMELKDEAVMFRYANKSNKTDDPLSMNLSNGQWHSIELHEDGKGQLLVTFNNSTVPLLSRFSMIDFLNGNDSWLTFGSKDATGFKGCLHNVRFDNLPELSFFANADSGALTLSKTRHFESKSLQNIRGDGCYSKDLCGPVNPCRNGALCRDLFNRRECDCAPGYSGNFCENNIDECLENKDCGPHGVCVDGINSFSCSCKRGWSGPLCNIELDQCISKPCKNEGRCETLDGKAVCSCDDNHIGLTCNIKRSAKCRGDPCATNNTLTCMDTDLGPQCECQVGFYGALCEEAVAQEMCANIPCKNGGTCMLANNGSSIECLCPPAYTGETCEKLKNNCKPGMCGHGTCRPILGGHLCECDEGWEGQSCDVDINECLEDFPCINNGTCINKTPLYECQCLKHYLGKTCEIVGICARNPCQNQAECIQKSATEYRCVCPAGFTGKNCESEIDYCLDEPCTNGASCQRIVGSYLCHCLAGFTGKKCETDIDECVENEACQNGGQCLDRVNGFECNCTDTGYQGDRCLVDVDECQISGKCMNGTCNNLPGSYECACKSGYLGLMCDMIDPCVVDAKNRTLHNCVHGNCANPHVVQQPSGRIVVEYECSCWDSYTGQFCTHVAQKSRPVSIGYILGPGVALLIVSVLLACMLFFFVARNRRANQGTYSPSTHEMNGAARVQMQTLQQPMKKQERLI